MLYFASLLEFSCTYCVSICAFLVPVNLLSTGLTIVLTVLGRPVRQIWQSVCLATIFALLMVLHVYMWFVVGVVMLPTFILLALAITCLVINFTAVIIHKRYFYRQYRQSISQNIYN